MKKKIIIIVSVFIGLLFLIAILVPVLFKGKILEMVKKEANKSLNASITFNNHIHLSLFKSFPRLYLKVEDIVIANKAPFLGDTLASVGSLSVSLNLMKAISGNVVIKTLYIDRANVYLHVLNDTINYFANWDIMLPSDDTTATKSDEEAFSVPITKYVISNSNFVYNDELSDIFLSLLKFDHQGKGDFSMDLFDLITTTTAEKATFKYDGIPYLSDVKLKLDAGFKIDMVKWIYTFLDNKILINELPLVVDGFIEMPEEDIILNLDFKSPETDFKKLISLIPALYANDFDKLTATGKIAFNGFIKGIYNDVSMPGFQLNLKVNNGMFKYPDLPEAVNNVFVDLKVDNPDGVIDHTVVNLKKLHIEFGKEPFDASVLAMTPESDPYLDASLLGKIDLSRIRKMIPLDEKTILSGIINTDLKIKGNMSSLDKKQYEKFYASGNLIFTSLQYFSPDFKKNLVIPILHLAFSPELVNLKAFKLNVDKSDLNANGTLSGFVPYLFKKGVLKGNLNLNSNLLNLNTLLASETTSAPSKPEKATTEPDEEESTPLKAFDLPGNIDFSMKATVARLIYDKMDMKNVICQLLLKDKKLSIQNLQAGLLNGQIKAKGYYESTNPDKPSIDFNLDIVELNIKSAYKTFAVIRKFVPIAKYTIGNVSGLLDIKSTLGKDMKPDYSGLYSRGILSIKEIKIAEFKPLNMMADALQMPKYKNLSAKNIKPSFKIEKGRFSLMEPIDFKIEKTNFNVSGSNGLDKSIDYTIRMDVPSEEIKSKSTALLKQIGADKINIPIGETVPLFVYMTGLVDKPIIKTSVKEAIQSTKEAVMSKVDEQKKIVEDKARAEYEMQKKIAEEKARKEAEILRLQIEAKKKEAEIKARAEAEKKKKQLEEEARKKIKGILK